MRVSNIKVELNPETITLSNRKRKTLMSEGDEEEANHPNKEKQLDAAISFPS